MGFDRGEIALRATAGLAFEADSPLLERALTNLIRNAIEAVASAPDPKIAVTATRSGGYVVFRVADNGPGLPEVVAANLFQPFLTTKEGGSGIGLCISAQIARLHGGDIIHEPLGLRHRICPLRQSLTACNERCLRSIGGHHGDCLSAR